MVSDHRVRLQHSNMIAHIDLTADKAVLSNPYNREMWTAVKGKSTYFPYRAQDCYFLNSAVTEAAVFNLFEPTRQLDAFQFLAVLELPAFQLFQRRGKLHNFDFTAFERTVELVEALV